MDYQGINWNNSSLNIAIIPIVISSVPNKIILPIPDKYFQMESSPGVAASSKTSEISIIGESTSH